MTTYYFSNSIGADANAGTSPASPKQTLQAAATLFTAGHTILLATGDIWTRPAAGGILWDPYSPVHNGQMLGAYASGWSEELPLIDSCLYVRGDDTGWTLDGAGTGRWYKDFTGTILTFTKRCWPNVTNPAQKRNRMPFRWMTSSAAVTQPSQFFASTTTVYVGTGSDTIPPPAYYGGLCFSVGTLGSNGYNMRSRRFIGERYENFVVQGGFMEFQDFHDGVTIQGVRNNGWSMDSPAINFNQAGDVYLSNLTVRECDLDMYTGVSENNGDGVIGGGNNGISCNPVYVSVGYMRNIDIVDVNCRGTRHTGIDFQPGSSCLIDSVRGVTIRATRLGRSVMKFDGGEYDRGLACAAAGFLVKNIITDGANVGWQVGGSGQIQGCQWINGTIGFTNDLTNRGGEYGIIVLGPQNVTNVRIFSNVSIDITGCYFENLKQYAIVTQSGSLSNSVIAHGEVRITNCTFIDQTYYYQHTTIAGAAAPFVMPPATIFAWSLGYTNLGGYPTMANNVFILPQGATTTGLCTNISGGANASPGNGSSFRTDSYGVLAAPGGATTPITSQILFTRAAAGLSESQVPSSTSPLYRAGTYNKNFQIDGNGNARYNPPSIGAMEG